MGVERIVSEAASKLTSKTFGGVSKESAMEAIKAATEKAVRAGEEAVAKITQELQAYKGKSAQEMAELTSQRDKIILETKNEAQAAVEAAQKQAAEQVKTARATKVFEKTLPNGGKEVRKVNANGATMVKEYNANGQLLKSSVTQLDGSIRRTTYNPVTGKPVRTYTNVGGERLMEYTDGTSTVTKAVNKKKVRAEKPTLVSQSQPKQCKSQHGEYGMQVERVYSDGSKDVIEKYSNCNNNRTIGHKYDADGYLTENKIVWANDSKSIRTERFSRDGLTSHTESYLTPNGKTRTETNYYAKAEFGDMGRSDIGGEFSIGNAKMKYTRIKDEFGMYTDQYRIKLKFDDGKSHTVVGDKSMLSECRKQISDSQK